MGLFEVEPAGSSILNQANAAPRQGAPASFRRIPSKMVRISRDPCVAAFASHEQRTNGPIAADFDD
ncbi:hypothetical protein ACF1BQ_032450 [Bradyrhizobium sp. RDT10]